MRKPQEWEVVYCPGGEERRDIFHRRRAGFARENKFPLFPRTTPAEEEKQSDGAEDRLMERADRGGRVEEREMGCGRTKDRKQEECTKEKDDV